MKPSDVSACQKPEIFLQGERELEMRQAENGRQIIQDGMTGETKALTWIS